ncbi:hypothetical protein RchiOBHm_Chr5g0017841 [Rosa chinensis]|uniref:Uncharacterized protein n=1 Tax=Rosa chinensis TaxID=74649 RepID=A0A2P6Q6K3_ROSCH|nr:hypothetical protein RchiOBHm_Chr5g0017841 [Rosa chinensis]
MLIQLVHLIYAYCDRLYCNVSAYKSVYCGPIFSNQEVVFGFYH